MIIDPYTWHKLTIDEIAPIAEATVAVRAEKPAGYQFRAGQYAVVRVNGTLLRQYSFASSPDNDKLEFIIQHEPEGQVSSWFYNIAKPGDSIEISQAFGNFTLDPHNTRPVLMIAGRVGIAPFMSMLRERPRRPVQLLYSVRNISQVVYGSEIAPFQPNIVTTATLPRISSYTLAPLLVNKPMVYVCGSKQFVDAIVALVQKSGVAGTDIRRELFTLQ